VVWLSYNEPAWLAERHGLGSQAAAAVTALTAMLRTLAEKATTASQREKGSSLDPGAHGGQTAPNVG
jgi:hypothetical protein